MGTLKGGYSECHMVSECGGCPGRGVFCLGRLLRAGRLYVDRHVGKDGCLEGIETLEKV